MRVYTQIPKKMIDLFVWEEKKKVAWLIVYLQKECLTIMCKKMPKQSSLKCKQSLKCLHFISA